MNWSGSQLVLKQRVEQRLESEEEYDNNVSYGVSLKNYGINGMCSKELEAWIQR